MTAPEGPRFFPMLQAIRSKISGLVAKVSYLESDVHDLGGLLDLGERLWS